MKSLGSVAIQQTRPFVNVSIKDVDNVVIVYQDPVDVAISHSDSNDQGIDKGKVHPLGICFFEDDVFRPSSGAPAEVLVYQCTCTWGEFLASFVYMSRALWLSLAMCGTSMMVRTSPVPRRSSIRFLVPAEICL